MGCLRLYLALCVVSAHSGKLFPWPVHNGLQSVEIFFLISGFYMALISPKYLTVHEFYSSRALRIYIPYWIICSGIFLASLLCGVATGKWLQLAAFAEYSSSVNGFAGAGFAALTNISIFGIDWLNFLSDEPDAGLQLTTNGLTVAHPLCRYTLIQPAWSIGVELTFYLLVPFLNRCRTRTLVGLALLSLLARVSGYEFWGLTYDPWTYRFVLFAMAIFIYGMICCRLSCQGEAGIIRSAERMMPKWCRLFPVQVVLFLALFCTCSVLTEKASSVIPVRYANLVSYLVWGAIIPFLFALTKSNQVDRRIGELSYPVYLVHYFIASLVAAAYTRAEWLPESARATIVSAVSVLISLVLARYVIEPVEKRRTRWARRLAGRFTEAGPSSVA